MEITLKDYLRWNKHISTFPFTKIWIFTAKLENTLTSHSLYVSLEIKSEVLGGGNSFLKITPHHLYSHNDNLSNYQFRFIWRVTLFNLCLNKYRKVKSDISCIQKVQPVQLHTINTNSGQTNPYFLKFYLNFF